MTKQTITAAFWAMLIFITSCFVIPFDVFVRTIQSWSGDRAFRNGFALFWGVSWFFVVKGWHFTEYALLTAFLYAALGKTHRLSGRYGILLAFVLAVLFAASDEWHQTFVPHRDGNIRDVLIDSAGAALTTALLFQRDARRRRQYVARPPEMS